jgi:hypothetical protein
MIKIFAKHQTTKKVLIVCKNEQVRGIQLFLNNKFGGSWLVVDKVNPRELLKFDDGLLYKGFHGKDERYVNGIDTL